MLTARERPAAPDLAAADGPDGPAWARTWLLVIPILLDVGIAPAVYCQQLRTLGTMLRARHVKPARGRRRTPMDIDRLVDLSTDTLVALSTAHDHQERSAADERSDELLRPILDAPVAELRTFAQRLAARLRADERVHFLVWSGFERFIAPLILMGSESAAVELRTHVAHEIAALVERQLDRGEVVMAIAAALEWRDPETLGAVKAELEAGGTECLRGGESCLFLHVYDAQDREVACVVL